MTPALATMLVLFLVSVCAATDLGLSCSRDSDCTGADTNLRCFGPPGSLRCSCRHRWRPRRGVCRGPRGEEEDTGREVEEESEEELVSLLAPPLALAGVVLVVSLYCCRHVHRANRQLMREARQEERGGRAEPGDKYQVEGGSRPASGRPGSGRPETAKKKRRREQEADKREEEDEADDGDSGLFEMTEVVQTDRIETVSSHLETPLYTASTTRPLSSQSRRPTSARETGQLSSLHPLHGLLQPTGRVPQAGYQANMRLLFSGQRSRPASAETVAGLERLEVRGARSRPASAVTLSPGYWGGEEEEATVENGLENKTPPVTNGLASHSPAANLTVEVEAGGRRSVPRKASTQSRSGQAAPASPSASASPSPSASVSARPSASASAGPRPLPRPARPPVRRSVSSDSSQSSRPSSDTRETLAEKIIR